MSLSASNGAARERARAFLEGWTVADRNHPLHTLERSSFIDLNSEPTVPANGVLLACFLRGMYCRFAKRTDELDAVLLTEGA